MSVQIRKMEQRDRLFLPFMAKDDDGWADTIRHNIYSMPYDQDGSLMQAYVAADDDELVGFVFGFALPNKLLIPELMYVKPSHRRKGISKKLLRTLEENSGCTMSQIFYNKSLHDCYAKQGYCSEDNLEAAYKVLHLKETDQTRSEL